MNEKQKQAHSLNVQKISSYIDEITSNLCLALKVPESTMFNKSRLKPIIDVKRAVLYFVSQKIKEVFGEPFPTIVGRHFKIDHATVLHHCNKMRDYIETKDLETMHMVEICTKALKKDTLFDEEAIIEQMEYQIRNMSERLRQAYERRENKIKAKRIDELKEATV
jgi:hypothetical protein